MASLSERWERFKKDAKDRAGDVGGAIKKGAGDLYSVTTKQPTQALYKSVQQRSVKPLQDYAKTGGLGGIVSPEQVAKVEGIAKNVLDPFGVMGSASDPFGIKNLFKKYVENQMSGSQSVMGGPEAKKELQGFSIVPTGVDHGKDYGSLIGGPEGTENFGNIQRQFGNIQSLSKMREQAALGSEKSAIARRLAATGMGASGAGMRMQEQAQRASARRGAETGLGLAAEQAGQEQRAREAALGRNLAREQLKLGAAESAAERAFRQERAGVEDERWRQQMEEERRVADENMKIARSIQRYNEQGLLGQLFTDILGFSPSMKYPLGER